LSLFNCLLDSLTIDSPVIDDVYTALKESELHSTDLLPYWKVDFLCKIIPGQVQAENAVMLIMHTVEELIMKCKEIEVENEQMVGEDDVNEGDPSILRFLLASRDKSPDLERLQELMETLVPLIPKSVKDPRSVVCKTALMTCADIFKAYGSLNRSIASTTTASDGFTR
jgi:carotenoid epsilon hydroxylase